MVSNTKLVLPLSLRDQRVMAPFGPTALNIVPFRPDIPAVHILMMAVFTGNGVTIEMQVLIFMFAMAECHRTLSIFFIALVFDAYISQMAFPAIIILLDIPIVDISLLMAGHAVQVKRGRQTDRPLRVCIWIMALDTFLCCSPRRPGVRFPIPVFMVTLPAIDPIFSRVLQMRKAHRPLPVLFIGLVVKGDLINLS